MLPRPSNRACSFLAVAAACVLAGACATTGPATDAERSRPLESLGGPSALQLAGCLQPAGPAFTAGPYLTGVSNTAAQVMLQLAGAAPPKIHLGEYPDGCSAEMFDSEGVQADLVEVAGVPFAKSGDLVPENLYAASLSFAPAPSERRYCYGIELPATKWQPQNYYFCSPSLADGNPGTSFTVPGEEGDRFSFYVYGDTRDPTGFNGIHQEVADLMVEDLEGDLQASQTNDRVTPASLVINTGDYAYTGCQVEDWINNFFAPARALLQQLPIFAAPGNHESYSTQGGPECKRASFYFSFFGSLYDPATSAAKGVYAFDHHNARFITLSLISNKDKGKELFHDAPFGDFDPASCDGSKSCGAADLCGYRWLECQLDDAAADPGIDHVFVYYHAPLITAPPVGKHASSEFQITNLAPLFERSGKVTAVINGHNHFYERSLQLTNLCPAAKCGEPRPSQCSSGSPPKFQFPDICWDVDPARGITYIISGGGGASPYLAPPGPFPDQWLARAASEYEYLKITVDGDSATLETVGFDSGGKPFRDRADLR